MSEEQQKEEARQRTLEVIARGKAQREQAQREQKERQLRQSAEVAWKKAGGDPGEFEANWPELRRRMLIDATLAGVNRQGGQPVDL